MRRILMGVLVAGALVVALAVPAAAHTDARGVDETRLPVGGAPVSEPKAGSVYSCQSSFAPGGGGAQATGDWMNGDGTFDLTKKPAVDGSVRWDGTFSIHTAGSQRILTGNGLPKDTPTGEYPVSSSDDAYQYDRNPNSIREQTIEIRVPSRPKLAATPSCTGMAIIGVLRNGVPLFNALDAGGRDAVAYEIQDECEGHPQQQGQYHYHSLSTCVLRRLDSASGPSRLLGYALDGFGIYGPRDAHGRELATADLDECHGTTSVVTVNGKRQRMYHYVATRDYPYTVGCFAGTPTRTASSALPPQPPPGVSV
jgi:hypothetical protein